MIQPTLFTVDASDVHEAAHRAIPNFYEAVARRKLNAPEAWRWHRMEVVAGDVLVTGAVPVGFTRKGYPKWPSRAQDQRAVVTDAEYRAEREAWTARTGLCWNCGGCGDEMAWWSAETGRRYRPCTVCRKEAR